MRPNKPSKPDRTATGSMSSPPSPAMEFALRLGSHSDARRVPNAVLGTIIFVAAEVMFFAGADQRAHHRARFGHGRACGRHRASRACLWNEPPSIPPPCWRAACCCGWPIAIFQRAPKDRAALSGGGDSAGRRFCLAAGSRVGPAHPRRPDADFKFARLVFLSDRGHARASRSGGHRRARLGLYSSSAGDALRPEVFTATQVFWYFVVLLWPIIYLRVYL